MNSHSLSIAIVIVNISLNMLQVLYYWYSVICTVKTGLVSFILIAFYGHNRILL